MNFTHSLVFYLDVQLTLFVQYDKGYHRAQTFLHNRNIDPNKVDQDEL